MMMAVLVARPAAQSAGQPAVANQAAENPAPAAATHRVIVVSLEDRRLALVEDGKVKRVYTVAVGKPSTPSPVGTFTIGRRAMNPTYSHNGRVVPPGPNNPVGTRWMGLSIHGYGIHGTNEPNSIGKAASHGCIRMAKADLEELYPMVAVGDTVELIGKRNEQTAQLFGEGKNPAPTAWPAAQTAIASAAPTVPAAQRSVIPATISTLAPATLTAVAGFTVAGSM
jgi:lipoprotein-anchoring transpeptidase ErfK/SrfK